jgi:hypothetical protein
MAQFTYTLLFFAGQCSSHPYYKPPLKEWTPHSRTDPRTGRGASGHPSQPSPRLPRPVRGPLRLTATPLNPNTARRCDSGAFCLPHPRKDDGKVRLRQEINYRTVNYLYVL